MADRGQLSKTMPRRLLSRKQSRFGSDALAPSSGATDEREPTPAEIHTALVAACRHRSVRKAARRVDAMVGFDFGREYPTILDLRRASTRIDAEYRPPDVTLSVLPELAHAFWCGGLSGPCLLITGNLRLCGHPVLALGFVRAMPAISKRYNELTGSSHLADLRLPVLRGYRLELEDFAPLAPPAVFDAARVDHQILAATALLAGLHPVCRRVEVEALLDDLSWQRAPDNDRRREAMRKALHTAGRLAASGSADRLYQRTRGMRSEPVRRRGR
jgi:hypothetical protein